MSQIDQPSESPTSLASRTGFSPDAVESMRQSMLRGGGGMAQFDHREFGGLGQWMRGGLLMIADPSDLELKRRIDRLCEALSAGVAADPVPDAEPLPRTGVQWQRQGVGSAGFDRRIDQPTWYPASLGTPDTSGSQNDLRYAWFAAPRRLAVDRHGVVTLYDTGDHRIGGVAQQQGAGHTLSFVSQHGDVDLDRLPVIGGERSMSASARPDGPAAVQPAPSSTVDPFVALEKLADLHARGVLDDREFATKKAELLKRI